MLQWIHDHLSKAYWLVLAPLTIAFAFWGIQGVADLGGSNDREFKVNGERIPVERVREAYQRKLAELSKAYPDEVPAEMKAQLQDTIIDQFVNTTLIGQAVKDNRYTASDQQVREAIRQLPYFQVAGQFSSELYFSTLKARGISPEQFEADERADLATQKLQIELELSAFATLPEAQRAAVLQGEKREWRGVLLPFERFLANAHPDEAAINEYYKAHREEFKSEDTVALSYIELKMDEAATHPSDATLKAYFETIKERFAEPERRHARHILIKATANPEDAKAKAQKIYAEALKKDSDFAALAKQYSEDAGSAAQGGDLGLAEKSFFVGPFADAMFAMKAGEIKGPVKSEFGYHIIKLEEIVPGKIADFDKVRSQVESEYRKNESEKQFNDNQEKLERLAFEQSGSLNPLAAAINAPIKTVAAFHKGMSDDAVLANPKVLQAAFSADVLGGQNSRPIEIAPGDVVVLRVSDHRPPVVLELGAVKERVVKALQQTMASARQKAAYDAVVAGVGAGKPLEDVLASVAANFVELKGLKLTDSKLIGRKETGIDPALRGVIFKMAPKAHSLAPLVPVEHQDAWLVELLGVRPGDPAADAPLWGQLLTREHASMDLEVYLARLRDQAKITYNRKALFE